MESRGGAVWLWSQSAVEWMLRAPELQKLSRPGLGRLPRQGDTWRCATKDGRGREWNARRSQTCFRTSCCGWGGGWGGTGARIPPAEEGLAPPLGWQWGAGARAREGDQDQDCTFRLLVPALLSFPPNKNTCSSFSRERGGNQDSERPPRFPFIYYRNWVSGDKHPCFVNWFEGCPEGKQALCSVLGGKGDKRLFRGVLWTEGEGLIRRGPGAGSSKGRASVWRMRRYLSWVPRREQE